jgi:AraC-like DNA-binding protein
MRYLTQDDTRDRIATLGLDQALDRPFAFEEAPGDVVYDWHSHQLHQLLYASDGTMHVETAGKRLLLPPRCAIWIPADVLHRTWLKGVRAVSVFFPKAMIAAPPEEPLALAAPSLLREMLLFATRWGQDGAADALAAPFFSTLALLCREWCLDEKPYVLPRSDHPGLARAMDYAQGNLAEATLAAACRAAGMSERSLRRRFSSLVGMGWHDYLHQSRLLQAMALLSQPDCRIADAAEAVGFTSLSAFAKAFRAFSGETPSRYRQRLASA